jgi:hypothetical protein
MAEHESLLIVFRPPLDLDFLSSFRNLIFNNTPKPVRRFFIGPITGDDGSRCFAVLPCCSDSQLYRQKLVEVLEKAKKQKADIVHISFGGGDTTVPFSTDDRVDTESMRLKLRALLVKNKVLQIDLEKLEKWRKENVIVDEAINVLDTLENYKAALDFLISNISSLDNPEVIDNLKKLIQNAKWGNKANSLHGLYFFEL